MSGRSGLKRSNFSRNYFFFFPLRQMDKSLWIESKFLNTSHFNECVYSFVFSFTFGVFIQDDNQLHKLFYGSSDSFLWQIKLHPDNTTMKNTAYSDITKASFSLICKQFIFDLTWHVAKCMIKIRTTHKGKSRALNSLPVWIIIWILPPITKAIFKSAIDFLIICE